MSIRLCSVAALGESFYESILINENIKKYIVGFRFPSEKYEGYKKTISY